MTKSRSKSKKSSLLKGFKKTTSKAVYGALATGFDMGIKGVSKGVKTVSKMSKKNRSKRHHKNKRGGTSRRY